MRVSRCLLLALLLAPSVHALPPPALPMPLAPPQGCDDLAAVPMNPEVDYSAVQQVWMAGGCASCHNTEAPGGLRLDEAKNSIVQLVYQPSPRDPLLIRVRPLEPDFSLLMQMINCTPPVGYPTMPPGGNRIAPTLRARVYDWIAQGARGTDEDGNPVSDVVFNSRMESQRFQQGVTP